VKRVADVFNNSASRRPAGDVATAEEAIFLWVAVGAQMAMSILADFDFSCALRALCAR